MWYTIKTRHTTIAESGEEKIVTDLFLVEAMSIMEAYDTYAQHIESHLQEAETLAISKYDVQEVVNSNAVADHWYRYDLRMITIDERTGKERKQPYAMLINANNTDDARTIYNKVMSKSVVDYEIKKIAETKIIEVVGNKLNADEID